MLVVCRTHSLLQNNYMGIFKNANVSHTPELVITLEMKLTLIFCLFALVNSKAITEIENRDSKSSGDKQVKRLNVRDNVMKVSQFFK